MAGKPGAMSGAQSKEMYRKIVTSRAANENARRDADLHRLSDPIEQAKTYLRSRGFHVFAEHVLGGALFRSTKIRVGTNALTSDEVIAMAVRLRAR